MSGRKTKVIAGLQFGPAVLAALIGYFILTPRFGIWGVASTILAGLLALYWLAVLLRKPRRRTSTVIGIRQERN